MHVSIAFCTRCWNIKLASCFCGIARIHVFSCVLHVLRQYQTCDLPPGQYQTRGLLLRNRPNSCLLLCSTCIGAVSGWRVAPAGSYRFHLSYCVLQASDHRCNIRPANPSAASHKFMFVLCVDTHLDSSRLTSCCCGVARIHASIAFYTH